MSIYAYMCHNMCLGIFMFAHICVCVLCTSIHLFILHMYVKYMYVCIHMCMYVSR